MLGKTNSNLGSSSSDLQTFSISSILVSGTAVDDTGEVSPGSGKIEFINPGYKRLSFDIIRGTATVMADGSQITKGLDGYYDILGKESIIIKVQYSGGTSSTNKSAVLNDVLFS